MRTFWTNTVSAAASVILTAGIVAFATPGTANAAVVAAPQIRLSVDPAAATDAASRALLERRIHSAASQVCDTRQSQEWIAEAQCRAQAIAQADRDVAVQLSMLVNPAVQLASN
ncbi:UrcA family protein [Sphingomonas abietis]|uniref:UrcA family protein n=1 Tax=Sphingomonas abietis TaxID=3012344 RepID=A0ABY7NRU4_9SPHN|nr:UrcA family protein [Sphingomonas abietis]WBO22221.1 UrcA family protein [Sphingomonas abietis]